LAAVGGLFAAQWPQIGKAEEASSVGELLSRLRTAIANLAQAPAVVADWQAVRTRFCLDASELPLLEFASVRTIFEATRSGGFWRLRWEITNREPNSANIWKQWRQANLDEGSEWKQASASAECDELSALFAFLAYRCNVRGVGLFWPVWNHVVAVWVLRRASEKQRQIRIVIPTSQIMLPANAGLGDSHFNPFKQKTIFEYRRNDVELRTPLPRSLVDRFIDAIDQHGGNPTEELARMRHERVREIGGSDFGWLG
jgi:hypothetical protein